jgi:hypothetical protein
MWLRERFNDGLPPSPTESPTPESSVPEPVLVADPSVLHPVTAQPRMPPLDVRDRQLNDRHQRDLVLLWSSRSV